MRQRARTTLALICLLPVASVAYAMGCDESYLVPHQTGVADDSAQRSGNVILVFWWILTSFALALVLTTLLSLRERGVAGWIRDRRSVACSIAITIAMGAIYWYGAADAERAWMAYAADHYPPDHKGPYDFLFADVRGFHSVSGLPLALTIVAAAAAIVFTTSCRKKASAHRRGG